MYNARWSRHNATVSVKQSQCCWYRKMFLTVYHKCMNIKWTFFHSCLYLGEIFYVYRILQCIFITECSIIPVIQSCGVEVVRVIQNTFSFLVCFVIWKLHYCCGQNYISFKGSRTQKFVNCSVQDVYLLWSPSSKPFSNFVWPVSVCWNETTWLENELPLPFCCYTDHCQLSEVLSVMKWGWLLLSFMEWNCPSLI